MLVQLNKQIYFGFFFPGIFEHQLHWIAEECHIKIFITYWKFAFLEQGALQFLITQLR